MGVGTGENKHKQAFPPSLSQLPRRITTQNSTVEQASHPTPVQCHMRAMKSSNEIGENTCCSVYSRPLISLVYYLHSWFPSPPTWSPHHPAGPLTTQLVPSPPTWSPHHPPGPLTTHLVPSPPTWSPHHPAGPLTAHLVPSPPTWSPHHPPGPLTTHLVPSPPTWL